MRLNTAVSISNTRVALLAQIFDKRGHKVFLEPGWRITRDLNRV